MARRFTLQYPDRPTKKCRTDLDTDRSTCCGAELVWFEYDRETGRGSYIGCEACGAYSTTENGADWTENLSDLF